GTTSIGKGVAEDQAVRPIPAQNLVSRGMTRGKVKDQNLLLVSGGLSAATTFAPVTSTSTSTVTALRSATALKQDPNPHVLNEAELNPIPSPPPSQDLVQLRSQAQMQGYTGDQCSNCNSMR